MSVCPFICAHGTAELPLVRFARDLIFEYFSKASQEKARFIKI